MIIQFPIKLDHRFTTLPPESSSLSAGLAQRNEENERRILDGHRTEENAVYFRDIDEFVLKEIECI